VHNLHRLRALLHTVTRLLFHVRHLQEPLVESAHQPLKRAIRTGNGRNDALRAVRRMQQEELAFRIALQPAYVGLDPERLKHARVMDHVRTSKPLWSRASGDWRCSGGRMFGSQLPIAARDLIETRWHQFFVAMWKGRDTRGEDGWLLAGECVGVPVAPASARSDVCVARREEVRGPLFRRAYFRTISFVENPSGPRAAVVQPFVPIPDSEDVRVDSERFLYFPLVPRVHRALLLHSCYCSCSLQPSGSGHSYVNL